MEDFVQGVDMFIRHAISLSPFQIEGMIMCPYVKYKCITFYELVMVKTHLYNKGFIVKYFVWTNHDEIDGSNGISENMIVGKSSRPMNNSVQHSRFHDMLVDAFGMHFGF